MHYQDRSAVAMPVGRLRKVFATDLRVRRAGARRAGAPYGSQRDISIIAVVRRFDLCEQRLDELDIEGARRRRECTRH